MTNQPGTLPNHKLRINWFSNSPWAPTGYGVQTRINYPRIKALGYDLSITAYYGLQGGSMVMADGTKVYPLCHHPYGMDVIGAHAMADKANAIISLSDAWVMLPENMFDIDWYPWFPIDCEPMPKMVYEKVKTAKKGIVMSRFGEQMAKQVGLEVYYVPHSVETEVFKPIDRAKARARLGFPDKFIVVMVAANKGPRKSFFEQIAAFKAFHQIHPESMLYLHTEDGTAGGESLDLLEYCKIMGLKTAYADCKPLDDSVDVAFVSQYQYVSGMINDPYMVDVYNSLDVMMLCSMGEGFGVPLIEAQACGCPVISGDWTAMGELIFSGWKIPKEESTPTYNDFFGSFQYTIHVSAVVKRLIEAHKMVGNQDYRDRARAGAMAYDADKVAEKYWKPVLEDIEKHMDDSKDKDANNA